MANGKDIMMRIIDNDPRMPREIANDLGYLGAAITDAQVKAAVDDIVVKNPQIV